jgi:hypothetical protein
MESLVLGPIDYHEHLTFVWLAAGPAGEPEAAFVIDGRDYADAEQARAAVQDALEHTDRRAQVADFRPVSIPENEKELAYWTSWAEFRRFLDVYGPVYPWRRAAPVCRTPLYSGRHFECWGQLVETFPPGQGPYDPVLGRRAEGYGLNDYTGEFEPDTPRALQCAHGGEDDETWPMRDEDEFIEAVEERRERLLRESYFQRHDKPEIVAAYEAGQPRRATYELWRAVHRRRAYFLEGGEPVRVDLADDGAPTTVWRLDATGRIVPSAAETVGGTWITEHAWLLAIEERRRGLAVAGPIAEAYAKAAAEPDEGYRRRILTRTFDLWAEMLGGDS